MFLSASERAAVIKALAAGTPGLLAIVFLVPSLPGIPPLALAINPMALLFLASVAGAKCAPRLSLRSSLLYSDLLPLRILATMLAFAMATGCLFGTLDHLSAPLWRTASSELQSLLEASNPSSIILGLLYGSLTEEIILRWGLMSFVAAVASRIIEVRAAMIVGIWVAAILFALGHLPSVLMLDSSPSLGVYVRTVSLNLGAGLLFGFAFLRVSLEAAFVAHAGVHLGVALTAMILPALG